jgi:acetyl-CoA carboxylase/biotin carboxylase 1
VNGLQVYREAVDENQGKAVYCSPTSSALGPLHGVPLSTTYKPLDSIDRKRLAARRQNTTYCYDFPLVFETALRHSWREVSASSQGKGAWQEKPIFKATELILSDSGSSCKTSLVESDRPVSSNNIGMVAWSMNMCTPEFPDGRTVLIVSNDVTFSAGSFGPREDVFFKAVTDFACKEKLPLVYLAANSGARIGVAEEVRACFRVGWSEETTPDHGFQYLYLTPEDHKRIGSSVISHEIKLNSGEIRWVIQDVIGQDDGLGVENLSGSGAIAGAFSKAYQETFTLTYVTGRTVGIGAYLARLGMRCIQRLDQPIILTGFSALNKLLGREVYSSHMQLGGPKIMATNGVVHLTVADDLEGVSAILNWLSYIPSFGGGLLPYLKPIDPPERIVEYTPETACDPRAAIRGLDNNGKWLGGIFDKGSFTETLEGWAQTVVTGRARLGGIPVGIVAVETKTVTQKIPADPGQPDSHESVVSQAGQVWFPDSAQKTAQALIDFNKEGLPLFIMANWRGFSGGQRDLFEGILQAGSMIVEHLRTYQQPVFVFIPKTGELRGGAWVVVDSKINSDKVEMYAEKTAKGGVLEPEGMLEIKFRTRELLDCMHRLDPQLASLKKQAQLQTEKGVAAEGINSIQQQIKAREKLLLPVYKQIAIRFVELHDTPNRMAAKGVIKQVSNILMLCSAYDIHY